MSHRRGRFRRFRRQRPSDARLEAWRTGCYGRRPVAGALRGQLDRHRRPTPHNTSSFTRPEMSNYGRVSGTNRQRRDQCDRPEGNLFINLLGAPTRPR